MYSNRCFVITNKNYKIKKELHRMKTNSGLAFELVPTTNQSILRVDRRWLKLKS